MLKGTRYWIAVLLCWSVAPSAQAILTIEITQGEAAGLPVAIVPFAWAGKTAPPQHIANIIEADLLRSGRFAPIERKQFISSPQRDADVVYKDWRLIKAEALVIGSIKLVNPGRYQIEFRLYDIYKEKQLAGYRYTVDRNMLRTTAHQISDIVYEQLTGQPGAFTTRIAYITRQRQGKGNVFKLQVADSDGYAPKTIVRSSEPLLSPAWSPDGKRLAYVSFEHKRPVLYTQDLGSGRREKLAHFKGINSAPAWSPDGKRLAMTLSRDGNAEIYVMNVASRRLTRLTRNGVIDTEPAWSPNGLNIVFTSDRAGRPQIYRMKADGSDVERLTFEGSYNARPSYSPDGRSLTLVTRQNGKYHVGILRLDNLALQVLTDSKLDESPSFAPNGGIIIYATELRGRGVLASVSSDGRVRQRYRFETGDVREPAWSPYDQQLHYKE
ncbi:MAG: Tol-Pal system beta propeller repeat protein TolB [Gammaproteobacteria bacterium]|nr:MAG: Tol-Pal system beta propeller repeat protein TolB [Gammaproteobacteria bacterium]